MPQGGGGYSSKDIEKFVTARNTGKLSTKHRKLINQVAMTPDEAVEDLAYSISPESLAELHQEITSTTNPKNKKILLEEQERLIGILQSVMPTPNKSMHPTASNQPMQSMEPPPIMMDWIGSIMSKLWSSQ